MTIPAPEPPEVEAAELAAAEKYFRRLVHSWARYGARSDAAMLATLMAEYDRRDAECDTLRRQADASERSANNFYSIGAGLRADLARALPVVEAAERYIAHRYDAGAYLASGFEAKESVLCTALAREVQRNV